MAFKDIKGQSKPIAILKAYLKSSCISGAYLFSGQEGVGKYLTALNFAKAMNCENKSDDACDACVPCLKINKNQHPDVHIISLEAAEAIKIELIRDLKKTIALKPYEAKRKVFIINDAHYFTAEAANALLKILEEPPPDTSIILVTSKPTLLFKTIISRCQMIKFFPLKRQELKELLQQDYRLDNQLAHYLGFFSEGRIGKALGLLNDKNILEEKNRVIDEFSVSRKSTSSDTLTSQDRNDLRRQLNILAGWFRDIYFMKVGLPFQELINLDRKEELLKFINRYDLLELEEIFNCISNSLLYLEENVNIKLLLSNLKAELWRR